MATKPVGGFHCENILIFLNDRFANIADLFTRLKSNVSTSVVTPFRKWPAVDDTVVVDKHECVRDRFRDRRREKGFRLNNWVRETYPASGRDNRPRVANMAQRARWKELGVLWRMSRTTKANRLFICFLHVTHAINLGRVYVYQNRPFVSLEQKKIVSAKSLKCDIQFTSLTQHTFVRSFKHSDVAVVPFEYRLDTLMS